jgi:tetratricopeptide (TPR) repeat protein
VIFGRYRMAMVPPLALMASIGAWRMWELGRARSPRVAGYAAAVAAAAVITWVPAGRPADVRAQEGVPRAMAFYNLAVTQEAQGDLTAAVAGYRAAVAADPELAQAYINLGGLLARGGAFEEAIAVERTALRLHPDDAFAHVNLGNALLETGRLDEAEGHYQAALRADPTSEPARAGLGALGDARARAARR